ncbi:MAG: GDYXXLXY domain-containing protein [Thermodesulfobacteriota bacterium]
MSPVSRKAVLFVAVVLLQAAVLAVMAGERMHLLATGTPVMLACEPVDPRSLFSGDYVRLRYKISRISPSEVDRTHEGSDEIKKNDTVYVALKKDSKGELYRAAAVSKDLSELSGRFPAVLRATVTGTGNGLLLRYGLEDYFVPQDQGKMMERDLRNVTVEVRVGKSGDSAVSRVFFRGKEVHFE